MNDHTTEVFGPSGLFANSIPGYEHRDEQIRLSCEIEQAIIDRHHLLAEAPCGTGKSLAYLVPAIKIALERKTKIVVVTANIALQEQLVQKDLPLLQRVLPEPFTFALLKGKNNYLCGGRLFEELNGATEPLSDPASVDQLKQIDQWAGSTPTGDITELPFTPLPIVWSRVCGDASDCDGARCNESQCFSVRARRKAHKADIIVCNYHILFSHVKVAMATDMDVILPTFNYLICDEGHEMAEIARDFFGFRIGQGSFRRLIKATDRVGHPEIATELRDAARAYFSELDAASKQLRYKARIRVKDFVYSSRIRSVLQGVMKVWGYMLARAMSDQDTRLAGRMIRRAEDLDAAINDATQLNDPQNFVYFVEHEGNRTYLCSKMINPSSVIKSELFDRIESGIVTSATLTTNGTFDFIRNQLGLLDTGKTTEIQVSSPFDFGNQALLVVPQMKSDPTQPEYANEVAKQFVELIDATKGRVLGLFTSYRVMKVVVDLMRDKSIVTGQYPILVQGDAPRTQLVQRFRDDKHSVLLGVSSFWTGIDVPGEALSCLAIDRLPFPNPDDPVMDALTELDPKWFFRQSIPRAVITFRQGFGRLIRSKTDTGVIVMFDKRIIEKPYGKQFMRSLPDVQFSREWDHVREFIEACDQEREAREAV